MIREAISKIVDRQDLSEADMVLVMNEIMSGEATPAQIGSFITGLRMKGETIDEIVGAVKVMRVKAARIVTGIATAASTSPPPPRSWWPRPACRWPSTATARPARTAARPT